MAGKLGAVATAVVRVAEMQVAQAVDKKAVVDTAGEARASA